jgi:hypothetical protein
MAFEEKRVWILAVISIVTYGTYATIILRRAQGGPVTDVRYVSTLLWTIGISIVASIVLNILAAIVSPKDADKKDQRDKEIHRFGEFVGQWFLIAGAVAAMLMALVEWDYFWIANVIYLAFVLSTVAASATKILVYRRGFPTW